MNNTTSYDEIVVKEQQQQQQEEDPSFSNDSNKESITTSSDTKRHMICTWIFGFVVTMIDEAFPLYCISTDGGLNLEEKFIGQILSLSGFIFAVGQYLTYIKITNWFGLQKSIEIGCFIGLGLTIFIPISLLFDVDSNSDDDNNNDKWISILIYLGLLLGISKIMICMCFASLAISTNATIANKNQRGTINGLLIIGSSIAKGCGPISAGILSSISFSFMDRPYGAITVFATIGIVLGLPTFHAMKHLQQSSSKKRQRQ